MHILAISFTLLALGFAFGVIGAMLFTRRTQIVEALLGPSMSSGDAVLLRANVAHLRAPRAAITPAACRSSLPLAA